MKKKGKTHLKSCLRVPSPSPSYGPKDLNSPPSSILRTSQIYYLSEIFYNLSASEPLYLLFSPACITFSPTSLPSGFKSHLKCHFLRKTFSDIPTQSKVEHFHSSLQFSILILLILVIVYLLSNQIPRGYYMQGYRVKTKHTRSQTLYSRE